MVDTYGSIVPHGGGAFSGKDCTKVDRSASYAARYVAKNIVAAGLANKCEIQLSYAIGVAHPTSIMVDTFGSGKISDESLVEMIRREFDLRPAGIIQMLDLRRPIYKQTAAYGHFGRNDLNLPWERLDKVEELKKSLQEKEEKLDERKERILREANEQAHAILRDTKEYADQTMKLFHKFQKDHVDTASVEKERQNLKKRMSKAEKGMSSKQQKQKPKKQLKPSDLSLGDTVKVLSLNLKGTVSSHPDSKGYLFVQMGIIRSKVHISDLELVDEPVITTPSMQRTGAGKIRMSKAASISTEINLLGKTVDEAVAELDKYLDDAYIAHMKSVRIVHGNGTGALRKGVHNYLKRQKHVASFRLGEFGEGDAGVTIVEFKK